MDQTSNITDFFRLDFPERELQVCEEGTIVNAKIIKDKNLEDKISDYRFLVTRLCSCAHKDMFGSTLPMGFMNIDYGMREVERDLEMSLTLAFFYNPIGCCDVNTLKPAFYLRRYK